MEALALKGEYDTFEVSQIFPHAQQARGRFERRNV
jgi:hypothetical protein